jgi:dienelactone hydrolase
VKLLAAVSAALALAPAAGSATVGFPTFGAGCARADFQSGNASVRAEFCRTAGTAGRAIVLLHGCGGFSTFDHRLAVELPHQGISTLDVDYFARTPPPSTKGFCGGRRSGSDPFSTWMRIARDAAAALRHTTGVDPNRVGAVGWSLGGGVVLATAQGRPANRPFAAVAGFSTAGRDVDAAQMPPTILLSGGATDAIPLAETLPLYQALHRAGVASSLFVYPHGSHTWPGHQGTLGIERASAFLRRYLR